MNDCPWILSVADREQVFAYFLHKKVGRVSFRRKP